MLISNIVIKMIIAEQLCRAGEGPIQREQWVIHSNHIYDMSIVSLYSSSEQSCLNMMHKINKRYEFLQ